MEIEQATEVLNEPKLNTESTEQVSEELDNTTNKPKEKEASAVDKSVHLTYKMQMSSGIPRLQLKTK